MKEIKGGLLETQPDKRDFSFGSLFGLPKLEELPAEYIVPAQFIVGEQGNTDLCTAFASCAVSEDEEGVELAPEYTFAKTKELLGSIESWGADLRTACKSHLEYGALERKLCAITLQEKGRDFVANWKNYTEQDDQNAVQRKKLSYFKVTGQYDTFDNFRATLWQNRAEKRSIVTGVEWKSSWTYQLNGIIPKFYPDKSGFGHAFKICGWKQINKEPYLIAQLSNGVDIGDKGFFYFPRLVVNQEARNPNFEGFVGYTFKDMPALEAKNASWSWWIYFYDVYRKYCDEIWR